MATNRYLNMVFQGGGVRGIAYAGVLEQMPAYCKLHAVGGTSVGSIVAALLAVGRSVPDLMQTLSPETIAKWLDPEQKARFQRIVAAAQDGWRIWSEASRKGKSISAFAAFGFSRRHKKALREDIEYLANNRGIFSSERIRDWLDGVFAGQCFKDIGIEDLRIVAADTRRRRYSVYTKGGNPTMPIAEAVHASASIPIFFQPFRRGNSAIVDGGILSNFPAFLFAKATYPTIGFRLREFELPADLSSFGNYLKALVLTMMEAHDAERGDPPQFAAYDIFTSGVPSTKFDLTEADARLLVESGRNVGRGVNWMQASSPTRTVSFYDPKPDEALEKCLKETTKLFDTFRDKSLWPEELHEDVTATWIICEDWTTRYEVEYSLKIKGKRALFMRRYSLSGMASPGSLADFDVQIVELSSGAPVDVIKIPAVNNETTKTLVMCFVPPITEEDDWRRFRTSYSVLREFEATLGRGLPDKFTYSRVPAADDHRLKLRIRLLIDKALPPISALPSSPPLKIAAVADAAHQGKLYTTFEGTVGEFRVQNKAVFEITLKV